MYAVIKNEKSPFNWLNIAHNKLALVTVGIIVYFNALFNDFVWDDKTYVVPNSIISGLNLVKLFSPNNFNSYGYFRPITALYYSFVYALFSRNAFFFHAPQIALHITNGVLLFIFLKTFFNKKISFFLSILFIIHPIQVESASYIAQADAVLLFFFGILALLSASRLVPIKKNLLLTSFLLLLCVLSKETGVIFLILVPLLRLVLKKDSVLKHTIFMLGTLLLYLAIRLFIGKAYLFRLTFVPISQLSLTMRLANVPSIVFYYLKTFFLPIDLAISQEWAITKINFQNFYLPSIIELTLLLLLISFGIYLYKTKKHFLTYIFFCTWFVLGLGMHLQIFPLDMTVADAWFYVPFIGLLGIIGTLWESIPVLNSKIVGIIHIILLVIIILLSLRTIIRNADWADAITLYAHDAQISDNYNIESHLADELFASGKIDDALPHYEKSLALLPYDFTVSQIATIYERKGDLKKAKQYDLQAMNIQSGRATVYRHSSQVYINVGRFFVYFDDLTVGKAYIVEGLKEWPNDARLWLLLSLDEYKAKNTSEALKAIDKVYSLWASKSILMIKSEMIRNQPVSVPIQIFYN